MVGGGSLLAFVSSLRPSNARKKKRKKPIDHWTIHKDTFHERLILIGQFLKGTRVANLSIIH